MRSVFTPQAASPAGHYAQAIVHGGLIFVSGQLPVDPSEPERAPGPIEEQTEQVLRNVAAILEAAGSGLDRLLQVTIYLSDPALRARVNEVYARILGDHRPARAVIPCGEFRRGYQIEVQVIAAAIDSATTEGAP